MTVISNIYITNW